MKKSKVDLKALEETNGKTQEYYAEVENSFAKAVCDFVVSYENMLSKAENKLTMAYISQDIVKVFLKGANRLDQLNERINRTFKEVEEGKNNISYLESLVDALGHNIENKSLEFYASTVAEAHDNYLLEIMKSSNNEGVITTLKTSEELKKDILIKSTPDNKKRLEDLKKVQEFNRKTLI